MADEPEDKWADSNPLIGPGPRGQTVPAPARSWGEAAIDTGLDLTAGVVGAGRQILGANEALQSAVDPNSPGAIAARRKMDTAADLEGWIKSGRSEQAQETEREGGYSFSQDPGKYLLGAGISMIPYAPLALMGPYGVPVAMAMGAGQVRSDERERIRQTPIEEMRKNPQYVDLLDQGLSDEQARERLAVESTDPRKAQTWINAAPNMIGQGLTSGFGSAVVKGLGMPAMRGIKTGIAERVIESANKSFIRGRATGVGMGVTSGAAMGGGAELSRQWSGQTSGMEQGPTDYSKVGEAAAETAALFGPLGLGYRRPARFRPKAAVAPIGTDVEATAHDMADTTERTAKAPWGHRPTAAEPWGRRPDTEVEDLRRQQEEMGGAPMWSDVPGPREMVAGDIEPAVVPEMHPRDVAPIERAEEERGLERMEEQGYGPMFSRRPLYGEAPPPPSMGVPPREPRGARKGMPKMGEGDLGEYDPNFPAGEFGQQIEPGYEPGGAKRPRAPALRKKEQLARAMVDHELEQLPEHPLEEIGTVPQMPGEERAPAGFPVHEPPGETVPPPGRIPRVEAPGLPGAGDFPHEGRAGTPGSWRGGPAQRHIDEHLAGRDMATRGQIARALSEQTGQRSVGRLNNYMQQTLSKIRDVVDRALEHDAEGTIEAIRGGAKEVGVRERLDPDEATAVAALREGLENGRIRPGGMLATETTQGIAQRLGDALHGLSGLNPGVLLKNLPKTLDRVLKALPQDMRVEIKSAIRTNAREVADMLRGLPHKAEPGQWIREADTGASKRAKAEAKAAEAKAEGEVLVKDREEGEGEPGPRKMVDADIAEPARPPKVREMVARDIYPAPPTLSLSSEKVAARARKDAGKFKGKGLQAIEEANQLRLDRAAKAGRVVGQQRAMTEQGEATTVTSRKPTIVQRALKPGEKPKAEAAPAAPVPTRKARPSRVLPTLAREADAMEADRLRGLLGKAKAIKARMAELQRKAEAAAGMADQASGRASRAAFLKAEQASRDAIAKLQAEYERLGTQEYEAEAARDLEQQRARAIGHLRDVVADSQTTQILYDKLEDMLRRARVKYEKSRETDKDRLRQTDAQRKATERKPIYTQKNLIAENILKVPDAKERQAEVEALDKIVTGAAETTTTRAEAPERKAGQTKTTYRKVDETSALLPDPMNFITASLEGLKRIAKALAERAQGKIDMAEDGFVADHERRLNAGEAGWGAVKQTVGRNRGPHGLYYNHLVTYSRFIRAVKQFKGSPDMLRTMILNHYMAERLVMEGKSHKLKELHDEQMNFLRNLAIERYNTIKADGTAGEITLAKKALDAFNRELDDALYTESIDEIHHSIPTDSNFLEMLEEQGIQPGAISSEAVGILKRFVDEHNKDLLRDMEINERRRIEGKQEIQPYDVEMAKIHGDKWFDADNAARTEMIDERSMLEEYGGPKLDAIREPRLPVTGPRVRALEGIPEAGAPREAVPGDIVEGWQEQVKLVEAMDRPPSPVREGMRVPSTRVLTREHAARNLTKEARELRERIRLEAAERGQLAEMTEQEARAAVRNQRVLTLMERADQIIDNLETLPPSHRDAIWETELRLIEDELRQHYEESVPGAKKKEHSIGQVLEDASDLSKPGNLPRGAYVRRVSDFLKAGERDIRKSVGGLMYNLRQHLLQVADAAVGNMEVVALTGEQMALAAKARGLPLDTPAFYDRQTHRIIVSQHTLNAPNRAKILGHEITHPLTLRAMELLPDMRRKLEQQLQMLRDANNDLSNPRYDELRRVINEDPQMIANIHEMIAQLYNDGGRTAWALNQIEVPIDTSLRWRKGLQGNLQAVYSTIRGGLNDLLFRVSKKKLLNDTLLTTLDAFNDLQRVGEFQRPRREGGAMPYTTVPERSMPKAELELWSKYPAMKVGDVLAAQGKNRGKNAASLAIAENGMIHDVGLHDNHVSKVIKARGVGRGDYRGYFDVRRPTNKPWVHISKFTSFDGAVSVGIEHSAELTRSQASVLRQIQAEVRKAQRDGEQIRMLVQEYVDARYVAGNPANFMADWAAGRDTAWEAVAGNMETSAEKHARLTPLWNAGPQKFDYAIRGRQQVPDLIKYLDQNAHQSWAGDYGMLASSLRSFQHLVDDIEIRVLDDNDFRAWLASIDAGKASGVHMDVKTPYIVLPKSYRVTTAVHELAHAASVRALNEHPEYAASIKDLAERLQNSPEYAKWRDEMGYSADRKTYAFTNSKEFVAEFYSNWAFRELTKRVKLTPEEVKAFGGLYVKKNLFQVVVDTIARALRFGRSTSVERMTSALLEDLLERQGHLRDWDKNTRIAVWDAHEDLNIKKQAPSLPGAGSPGMNFHREEARGAPTVERKVEAADSIWKDTVFRLQQMGISGGILKASTFVDLRRRAEQGMQDVVLRVEDAWAKIETTAKKYFAESGAEDIARAIANEMKMPAGRFQELQDYVSLENHYRVSGSEELYVGKNAWVSKDSPYHEHYRKRHAELKKAYDKLTPGQKAVRKRVLDYYEKRHGEILDKNLRTVIKLRNMVPGDDRATTEALMKHVMKTAELTDADKTKLEAIGWRREGDTAEMTAAQAKFKGQVNELRGSPLFKKIQGVWYPSERRGQWVVEARYDLSEAAARHGGRKVDEHGAEWEFDTAEKAQAFYNDVAITNSRDYGGIHHEGTTQHVYKADADGKIMLDADGKPIPETIYSERSSRTGEEGIPGYRKTTTGAERRISAKEAAGEPGTVTRHRVEFNPLLLEFYENQRHAHERQEELRGDSKLTLSHVTPKRDTTGTYLDPKKASRTMAVLMDGIERGDAWENMDRSERAMIRRDLEEAAARHIMSVSARSQRIPKRYALGADKSLLRDFNDYSRNTSMTLAEMEHRPALSTAMKNMDDYVRARKHWTDSGDETNRFGTLRAKLQSEVHSRVFTRASDIVTPWWTKAMARVLQVSYMDKLMSPGFVVLNASEPWVLGAPLLAGQHGFRAYAEIGRAYGALGFGGMWAKGFRDAAKAAREGVSAKFEDGHALLRDRVKGEKDGKALQQLLDYGGERGYLDRDAGMELAQRVDPSISRTGKTLDYLDNISRQVNSQIENVNRGVIAIAAYRMALPKMGHEKAMQHAFEMVHDVSGNYGHWNTPAMFNDPRLKFALQFKRYTQRIVANYARMFANAWSGQTPEIRNASRKQLAIMFGSQIMLSGALGLPTEPIKAALLALSPITGFGPDEAEVWSREAMAKLVGNEQLAEGLMRGFPRAYLDIGIGTRVGHDSLLTHGTLGKKPDNWFAFIGHTLVGAPGSMMGDWAVAGGKGADAMGHLIKGNTTQSMADFIEFAQLALPFKVVSDHISAASNYLGGPKTMTPAGQPLGYQPNFRQAVMEAGGLRSGTQQEASDKRFAISSAKAQYTEQRTKALQMYVRASTPGEKRSIQDDAIRNSQARWPKDMWLSKGDFYKAEQRFRNRQSADPGDVGIHLSKKQAGLRDRFSFFTV